MSEPLDANLILLIAVVLAFPTYYWLQVARRKKNMIRFKLRRVGVYLGVAMIGLSVIPQYGYSILEAGIFSIAAGSALAFILIRPPSNTRRIPARVRREVIARDLKGEPFDPNIHCI